MQTHRIPLFRRGQAEPIAFTIVDAADARWLLEHRWGLGSDGYATRRRPGVAIRMHREILGLAAGDGRHTDHINRDKLDNRRANLRVVTAAQNMQNRPSVPWVVVPVPRCVLGGAARQPAWELARSSSHR